MSAPTVLITGAAAGIGRATALTFAGHGYTVGAYDLDEEGLASLAGEIEAAGGAAHTGHLDVTDAEEFATRVGELVAATGRLDVLVNNAGILLAGDFVDIDVARHHREIDINTKGVVNGAHAGFEALREAARNGGTPTLVNLASASAIYGQPELANYSATKFFVRGLTEALDLEWGRHGIRVVALWPLYVKTAMTHGISTGTTRSMGIRLTAQDVADAVYATTVPSRASQALHQVHFPVGLSTKALSLGSRFSPGWLTRRVNKKFAGS